MNAQEAEATFRTLQYQRDSGTITQEQFVNRVNDLRYQDYNGDWWQIGADDGGWMRWTGSSWKTLSAATVPISPPVASPEQAPTKNEPGEVLLHGKKSLVAVASCIIGIVSFFFHPYIFGLLAIIFGFLSARKDRLGRIGVILGVAGIVINIIIQRLG